MLVSILNVIISVVMSLVCSVTAPLHLWTNSDYTPLHPGKERLTFATMSDIHLDDSYLRKLMFELGLKDLDNSIPKPDLLCLLGDNTDHGYVSQYESLVESLSKYNVANDISLVLGNHDTWSEDIGATLSHKIYKDFYKKITGREIDEVYFSMTVKGYHFIHISSEEYFTHAVVSDEQIQWLDKELAKASEDKKPIFVMCHWPLNQTHGLPDTWDDGDVTPMSGGLGEQSDAIDAVLQKYDNVFYITGHIHSGLTNEFTGKLFKYNSVEKHGNITCVNLPSYQYFSLKGVPVNGTGYVFEVYDDEVVIRARDYIGGFWLNNYEYRIDV